MPFNWNQNATNNVKKEIVKFHSKKNCVKNNKRNYFSQKMCHKKNFSPQDWSMCCNNSCKSVFYIAAYSLKKYIKWDREKWGKKGRGSRWEQRKDTFLDGSRLNKDKIVRVWTVGLAEF